MSPTLNKDEKIIHDSIICKLPIKKELTNLLNSFTNHQHLSFYTDGSLKAIGLVDCTMGFGWLQTNPHAPHLTFKGQTIFLPSSTRAEAFAILTALLCCPSNCTVSIFTDSSNCINNFYTFVNQHTISPRRKLKQNAYLVWLLIDKLIRIKSLNVSLTKVKAHSNDENNDKADELAKNALLFQEPIIINHKFLTDTIGFIGYNNLASG